MISILRHDLWVPVNGLYKGYIGIYRVEGFPKGGVPYNSDCNVLGVTFGVPPFVETTILLGL